MRRRIVVSIDRLVLRGVDRGDAAALADALQSELRHILAGGGGTLAAQGSTQALPAAQVRLPEGAGAAALGRAVAARIAGVPATAAAQGGKAGRP